MKKVYQTIIDKDHGNCMQAVVATLLGLELEEVPNFIEFEKDWHKVWFNFWKERGFEDWPTQIRRSRRGTKELINIAHFDKGINGYFYASVKSKLFEGVQHTVIVDMNLNIVHDPNPSGVYLSCTPDDVEDILVMTDFIISKTGKCFTTEDWDNLSEEEKDINTHKAGE